ncbi:unnamed protein product [Dracunculus medinensis]|uniref:GRIP domain-containing protein n=1 Tax=Dracunculus medinensis TaxID=318479 RepID=A0A0N4U6V4_DRAME|nr:unnamed protein product [Dracunculus medinensis]
MPFDREGRFINYRIPRVRSLEYIEATMDFSNGPPSYSSANSSLNSKRLNRSTHSADDDSDINDDSATALMSSPSMVSVATTSASSFFPNFRPLPGTLSTEGYCSSDQKEIFLNGKEGNEKFNQKNAKKNKEFSNILRNKIKSLRNNSIGQINSDLQFVLNHVDEACQLIDTKNKQLSIAFQEIFNKNTLLDEYKNRISNLEKLCENYRIASEKGDRVGFDKINELSAERDELLLRNASLKHQIEYERREWSIERERLSLELDDVTKELELQKVILNGKPVSEILNSWETKVFELQEEIADRDAAIRAQQMRISNLKESLDNKNFDKSPPIINHQILKSTILQFLKSSDQQRMFQSLRKLADLLNLTKDEQIQLHEFISINKIK